MCIAMQGGNALDSINQTFSSHMTNTNQGYREAHATPQAAPAQQTTQPQTAQPAAIQPPTPAQAPQGSQPLLADDTKRLAGMPVNLGRNTLLGG